MKKKIVFINQATGYLTIDIINEFAKDYDQVALIAGSVRVQDIQLDSKVEWSKITKYNRGNNRQKFTSWILGTIQIFYLLLFKYRKYEVFYFTVPPLAYLSSLMLSNKFSILVYDAYPDVLKTYNFKGIGIIYKVWTKWNKRLFKKAHRIYTLGDGMKTLLTQYVGKEKIIVIPNWTGLTKLKSVEKFENIFIQKNNFQNKFIVQYSGNIGHTHNVEVLVELANKMKMENDILFLIIGRGDRYKYIEQLIQKYQLDNCQLMPFQPDDMLNYSLSSADLGVVILDDSTAQISVPSKIYNLLAVGVPLMTIASKSSELAHLVNFWANGKSFEKNDFDEMMHFIMKLKNDKVLHTKFIQNSKEASKNYTIANAELYLDHYKEKVAI